METEQTFYLGSHTENFACRVEVSAWEADDGHTDGEHVEEMVAAIRGIEETVRAMVEDDDKDVVIMHPRSEDDDDSDDEHPWENEDGTVGVGNTAVTDEDVDESGGPAFAVDEETGEIPGIEEDTAYGVTD